MSSTTFGRSGLPIEKENQIAAEVGALTDAEVLAELYRFGPFEAHRQILCRRRESEAYLALPDDQLLASIRERLTVHMRGEEVRGG